jgi:antitoxin ParD1/3/4
MANLAKRTISLPAEHNEFIESKLRSGSYASASEVVRAGLRALEERDTAIENWLRGDVAAAYDDIMKHPERGIPMEKAFKIVEARRKTS